METQIKIKNFIKDIIRKYRYDGVIIGISGGLDSAVVAALCVKALGADKVHGVLLPERDSSKETIQDSILVCDSLGISYTKISITKTLKSMGVYSLQFPMYIIPKFLREKYILKKWNKLPNKDAFLDDLEGKGNKEFLKNVAYYRVKHRVRMCYLYLEAEKRNFAVMGTTNRTEYLTGFYVKWGDDATDIEPILHLYKAEVFKLAKKLGVPEKIINKIPTPDLIPGITDEHAFGMSYRTLDRILMKIERGEDLYKEDNKKVKHVKQIMSLAKKRELKMFGMDEYEKYIFKNIKKVN